MGDKFLSLLGLCRRAGKLVIGCDPVIDAVKNGQLSLLLFAQDASENTKKTVLKSASGFDLKIITVDYDKNDISYSIGKACAVAGVCDEGFAKKLLKLSGENDGEECNLC